ncbi:hypothetical protein D3C87_1597560 [compost metagenome]
MFAFYLKLHVHFKDLTAFSACEINDECLKRNDFTDDFFFFSRFFVLGFCFARDHVIDFWFCGFFLFALPKHETNTCNHQHINDG